MNVHTTNKWDKDFKFHVSSDLVLLLKNDIQRIVKVKSLSRARLFATPRIVACTKLLCPWDFQGKSTGVGCHFLLQGIFPTQGSNPGLSHCRQTLYHLSHQESPVFQHVSLNTGKSFLLSFIYFWLY